MGRVESARRDGLGAIDVLRTGTVAPAVDECSARSSARGEEPPSPANQATKANEPTPMRRAVTVPRRHTARRRARAACPRRTLEIDGRKSGNVAPLSEGPGLVVESTSSLVVCDTIGKDASETSEGGSSTSTEVGRDSTRADATAVGGPLRAVLERLAAGAGALRPRMLSTASPTPPKNPAGAVRSNSTTHSRWLRPRSLLNVASTSSRR